MSVNLSPLAGAGWQFFDDNGIILSGGLLYTYAAGTTTPETTYTSSSGTIANTNPIVLDSAGRTSEEVWLTNGTSYKFVIKTSTGVLIKTCDNIDGIGDFSNLLAELANTSNTSLGDALIGFKQSNGSTAYTGAVGLTVHTKLQEFVSVKDFGALGDGSTDDYAAVVAANTAAAAAGKALFFPSGTYMVTLTSGASLQPTTSWFGQPGETIIRRKNFDIAHADGSFLVNMENQSNLVFKDLWFDGQVTWGGNSNPNYDPPQPYSDDGTEDNWSGSFGVLVRSCSYMVFDNCVFTNFLRAGLRIDSNDYATRSLRNRVINCRVQRTRGVYGDSFYFGGVDTLQLTGCHAYDFQRIGYVTEFLPGGLSIDCRNVDYTNCVAEYGHDAVAPENNFGFWTESGSNILHTGCSVINCWSGFLGSASVTSNTTGINQDANMSWVNCSTVFTKRGAEIVGSQKNVVYNVVGCSFVANADAAPYSSGNRSYACCLDLNFIDDVSYPNASMQLNISDTYIEIQGYNASNTVPGGSPATDYVFGGIAMRRGEAGSTTPEQLKISIDSVSFKWYNADGTDYTGVATLYETSDRGYFGDIVFSGFDDVDPPDQRFTGNVTICNVQNQTINYCMIAAEFASDEGFLNVSNSRFSGRSANGSAGQFIVTNCGAVDFRDRPLGDSILISNSLIDYLGSNPDNTAIQCSYIQISNCRIRRQIGIQIDGGASSGDIRHRAVLTGNWFYINVASSNTPMLVLTQGYPLYGQVTLTGNVFQHISGAGSMPASACIIQMPINATSYIYLNGSGNIFDNAVSHVCQYNSTPSYNDTPGTVAYPYNTANFGSKVPFSGV